VNFPSYVYSPTRRPSSPRHSLPGVRAVIAENYKILLKYIPLTRHAYFRVGCLSTIIFTAGYRGSKKIISRRPFIISEQCSFLFRSGVNTIRFFAFQRTGFIRLGVIISKLHFWIFTCQPPTYRRELISRSHTSIGKVDVKTV